MATIQLIHSTAGEKTNKGIKINFDQLSANKVTLDMELLGEGITRTTFAEWKISSNGKQLDAGDRTVGNKAQLEILRFYSGSQHKPRIFTIETIDIDRKLIASYEVLVSAAPKIENAEWIDRGGDDTSITEAGFNTQIGIQIMKSQGIAGLPLNVNLYKIVDGKEEQVHQIKTTRDKLYNEKGFKLDEKHFPKLGAISAWLGIDLFSENVKLYFTISAGTQMLYNGKQENNYLKPVPRIIDKNKDMGTALSPVVISADQYFTQRYEPCKYEKINFVYGKQSGLVFDEKQSTNVRYPEHKISIIAGNNPNAEKVEIQLAEVDTKECQYNSSNKKHIRYRDEEQRKEMEEKHKDHKNNVFDTEDLEAAGISPDIKTESKLAFVPTYPYVENDYATFLMQFLTNGAQHITIPINTCRYRKKIELNIYPDALWTLHFNHFVKKPFFYKDKELPLQDNFYQLAINVLLLGSKNYLAFQGFLKLIGVFRKFVGEEVYKELAEYFNEYLTSVKLGLHAQFKGIEGQKTLDYSQHYLLTSQYIIYCNFCFRWILEILFLFLSRGGTLLKLEKKTAVIVEKAGRKIKKITDTLEKYNLEIIYPAIATNSACYYELQEDGQLALTIEHNVKADPLLGITYNNTFTLEDLIKLKNARKAEKDGESASKSTLEKIAEEAGLDASLTLNVDGTIEQEYNIKINTLTGKHNLVPIVGNYITNNQGRVAQKEAISIYAEFKGSAELKIDDFDISTSLILKGDAQGSISHTRAFGKDDKGIYFQDYTEMSKITGTYMMRAKISRKNKDIYDSNPEETPISFVAFDKEPIAFPKIYIFKI